MKYSFIKNQNEWATAGLDLNYFEARMYDPTLGRWHSPDPLEQFHSPYLALSDDPANHVDPDGRFSLLEMGCGAYNLSQNGLSSLATSNGTAIGGASGAAVASLTLGIASLTAGLFQAFKGLDLGNTQNMKMDLVKDASAHNPAASLNSRQANNSQGNMNFTDTGEGEPQGDPKKKPDDNPVLVQMGFQGGLIAGGNAALLETGVFLLSLSTTQGWKDLGNGFVDIGGYLGSGAMTDPEILAKNYLIGVELQTRWDNIPNMTAYDWGYATGYTTVSIGETVLLSKGAGLVMRAMSVPRLGIGTSSIGGVVEMSPFQLEATHGLTKSNRAFVLLKADIKLNGIREPLRFVEYNGSKYVVDGHHRLRIAKELGLKVPAIKVELPHLGYKNLDDLIYSH